MNHDELKKLCEHAIKYSCSKNEINIATALKQKLDELNRYKAALEKCKEQRVLWTTMYRAAHKVEIENMDKEIDAILKGNP